MVGVPVGVPLGTCVVGGPVGILVVGVPVGLCVVGVEVGFGPSVSGCWVHTPIIFVSDAPKIPPVYVILPSTRISYMPCPFPQQIPSPSESVMVNVYSPHGRHSLVEYVVPTSVYGGLVAVSNPHWLDSVHVVSTG